MFIIACVLFHTQAAIIMNARPISIVVRINTAIYFPSECYAYLRKSELIKANFLKIIKNLHNHRYDEFTFYDLPG